MLRFYFMFIASLVLFETNAQEFKTSSVLKEGTFYKIPISTSGLYRIDESYLKNLTGSDLSPSNISVYASLGDNLPESTTSMRYDDLEELPLHVLNDNSVIIYAEGPDGFRYHEDAYERFHHTYSKSNFIFIKTNTPGTKIPTVNESLEASYIAQSYDHVQVYEIDRVNLLDLADLHYGTGQDWFGTSFNKATNLTRHFDLQYIDEQAPAYVHMEGASRSPQSYELSLEVGQNKLSTSIYRTLLHSDLSPYAKYFQIKSEINPIKTDDQILINTIDRATTWIDYVLLNCRKTTLPEKQTIFSDEASRTHDISAFRLGGIENKIIFDITNPLAPTLVKESTGQFQYRSKDKLHTFIASPISKIKELPAGKAVQNQNLHAPASYDMVILHHKRFKIAAEKLAKHREEFSNLSVLALDVEDVYNEFSGGKCDPTAIRDFARMMHSRDPNFRHLLLFGDASFDYKNILSDVPAENFVPTFETKRSLDPIINFPSDDYFALLDNPDGGLKGDSLYLCVGRLPVTDINNAEAIVNKIIHYDTGKNRFGSWRTKLLFTSDDEDGNRHMASSERVSSNSLNKDTTLVHNKVYFDAYQQESTPGGDRYYEASDAINSKIINGQLVMTYLGHGGPKGWAQERVLKKTDIDMWTNYDRMPLLITATCTFAGYDDARTVSAGEYCIQKEDGGVIALYTTVRPVYGNSNEKLTHAIYDTIFKKTINGKQTIGEIFRSGKNHSNANKINSNKFTLLGDPAQMLAVPEYNISVNSINSKDIGDPDTLSAFEIVTIEGLVHDQGKLLSDFNGNVDITVFDKEKVLQTLANDGGNPFEYTQYSNLIFNGSTQANNGIWQISFVVPKDINYAIGKGRIAMYAYDDTRDAMGSFTNFYVGGTATDPIKDDQGPEISLYMDNRDFISGETTSRFPMFLIDLKDDIGINVSGNSLGHDITAVFDNDATSKIILNEFYRTKLGDYTEGYINIPLHQLSPGKHTVTVKAWDIGNNSGEATLEFSIPSLEESTLDLQIAPNPVQDIQTISINQNAFLSYSAELIVVDLLGREVVRKTYDNIVNNKIVLDTNGNNGGLNLNNKKYYFYKIILSNDELNQRLESQWQKVLKL